MARVDFFISYAGPDRAWAEWIAWQLEAAGHTTRLQAWDFQPGSDFVHQMGQALRDAGRLVAVLSPAYLASQFGEAEWRPVFAKDPTGERRLLLPVRVAACDPPVLLTARVYVDLVGLGEQDAAERLVAAVGDGERPGRPQRPPLFPGAAAPAAPGVPPPFPGLGPAISNLAPRNPHFTGRAELLDQLDHQLTAGGAVAVVAAHGLGGVGKTQLALEYAHSHADQFDLVWWVPAETRLLATSTLAELASRLGLPTRAEQAEQAAAALAELARRDRWLLVFDNADDPQALDGLWPSAGEGRILVTSRNPAWGAHGTRLAVDVLAQDEALGFLQQRTGSRDQRAAWALAGELGGLPLALEQAAAYLEETGISLGEYLARYRRYHAQLLGRGRPRSYRATVAATWRLNLEQLADNPAAADLLRLCAFLGPEAIPLSLLAADPDALSPELAVAVTDELALDAVVAALYRFSLLGRDHDGLRVHRLVSEVVRASLNPEQHRVWSATAVGLLLSAFPRESHLPEAWPVCQRLLPHALAAAQGLEGPGEALDAAALLLNAAGLYLYGRAEFGQSRVLLERALALQESSAGPDHPDVAMTLGNLGRSLRGLGEHARAKDAQERALRIRASSLSPDDPAVAESLNEVGVTLRDVGELDQARSYLERSLAIRRLRLGPDDPQVAWSLNNLGNVLRDLGDFNAARSAHEQALAIRRSQLGPDHPEVARSLTNLGNVLRDLGDLVGARTVLEEALAIREAKLGPDHPVTARSANALGNVLRELGELDEARRLLERALTIRESRLGADHPDVAWSLNNLGNLLRELDELDQARSLLERALTIREAKLGPDHPDVAWSLISLGNLLRELGQLGQARSLLERALTIREARLGPEHRDTLQVREDLASLLSRRGHNK